MSSLFPYFAMTKYKRVYLKQYSIEKTRKVTFDVCSAIAFSGLCKQSN